MVRLSSLASAKPVTRGRKMPDFLPRDPNYCDQLPENG
jgi:hypothetical protein